MKIGINTLFLIPGKVGGSETYLRSLLRVGLVGGVYGMRADLVVVRLRQLVVDEEGQHSLCVPYTRAHRVQRTSFSTLANEFVRQIGHARDFASSLLGSTFMIEPSRASTTVGALITGLCRRDRSIACASSL